MNKIVFFGTGPVAAKSLELLSDSFDIEAVITKPIPEHHKGKYPVIDMAKSKKIPLHFVTNRSDLDDLFTTTKFSSQIGVLIDFGIIVSKKVIDYFPLGIVNSHFSLLPQLRGADPITFAILSGQQMTGVSLMIIVEKMDEGPLLAQAPFEIDDKMTTPILTDELIELSFAMLRETIPKYLKGDIIPFDQSNDNVFGKNPSYSRRLSKADSILDFTKNAKELSQEIRAFHGWPGSKTTLFGVDVTITEAKITNGKIKPGTLKVDGQKLFIGAKDSSLELLKLKPAGKKEMSASAFISGYNKN